jgi:hypothetical protein
MKHVRWVLSALALVGLIGVVVTTYTPATEDGQPQVTVLGGVPSCCAGRVKDAAVADAAGVPPESGGCCPLAAQIAGDQSGPACGAACGNCPTVESASITLASGKKMCCQSGEGPSADIATRDCGGMCSVEGCDGCPLATKTSAPDAQDIGEEPEAESSR